MQLRANWNKLDLMLYMHNGNKCELVKYVFNLNAGLCVWASHAVFPRQQLPVCGFAITMQRRMSTTITLDFIKSRWGKYELRLLWWMRMSEWEEEAVLKRCILEFKRFPLKWQKDLKLNVCVWKKTKSRIWYRNWPWITGSSSANVWHHVNLKVNSRQTNSNLDS